jgi:proteasome alpha subunit
VIPAGDLEVAVLDRTRAQPRKFSRLGPARLESLLGDRGPSTPAPADPSAGSHAADVPVDAPPAAEEAQDEPGAHQGDAPTV